MEHDRAGTPALRALVGAATVVAAGALAATLALAPDGDRDAGDLQVDAAGRVLGADGSPLPERTLAPPPGTSSAVPGEPGRSPGSERGAQIGNDASPAPAGPSGPPDPAASATPSTPPDPSSSPTSPAADPGTDVAVTGERGAVRFVFGAAAVGGRYVLVVHRPGDARPAGEASVRVASAGQEATVDGIDAGVLRWTVLSGRHEPTTGTVRVLDPDEVTPGTPAPSPSPFDPAPDPDEVSPMGP